MLQLIHQIPAAGINYQRVPPGPTFTQEPEHSSSDLDLTPRQQTLNGDEVRQQRSNFDCSLRHLVTFGCSSVVVTTFFVCLFLGRGGQSNAESNV